MAYRLLPFMLVLYCDGRRKHTGKQVDMSDKQDLKYIILLIDDESATLPLLKALLNRLGYRVMTAVDEKDVFDNIALSHLKADLILLNQRMPSQETLAAGRRIRTHFTTDGDAPVVVIAGKYGKDMEGKDEQDGENDWITYLENSDQLETLLGRLLH